MIVRMNGIVLEPSPFYQDVEKVRFVFKPKNKKLKKLAIHLWVLSGTILTASKTYAADGSLWKEMSPIFGVFQDLAMVIGALAVMTGLIVMVFKKRIGWQVISTAGLVILGCFLVPSAVMLVAIVGDLLNHSLSQAFAHFHDTARR